VAGGRRCYSPPRSLSISAFVQRKRRVLHFYLIQVRRLGWRAASNGTLPTPCVTLHPPHALLRGRRFKCQHRNFSFHEGFSPPEILSFYWLVDLRCGVNLKADEREVLMRCDGFIEVEAGTRERNSRPQQHPNRSMTFWKKFGNFCCLAALFPEISLRNGEIGSSSCRNAGPFSS
jgi:hypothetical protein